MKLLERRIDRLNSPLSSHIKVVWTDTYGHSMGWTEENLLPVDLVKTISICNLWFLHNWLYSTRIMSRRSAVLSVDELGNVSTHFRKIPELLTLIFS